jgi:hypothetical protein
VDRINTGKESEPHQRNVHGNLSRNKALYENLLKGKLDQLTNEKKGTVQSVLLQYAHVCHDEETAQKAKPVAVQRGFKNVSRSCIQYPKIGLRKNAEKWLSGQDTYTVHKTVRNMFPRNPCTVTNIDDVRRNGSRRFNYSGKI